jgi:hypothetical protein
VARCGRGGGLCNCRLTAGENITISGSGSDANAYVILADVPCESVRTCLSGADGINFDTATGVISADLSGQAGNNLVLGGDGGLYVPTAGGAVLTGCGLTGDGTGSAPRQAATGTWPYQCSVDTAGSVIACDSSGRLRGEPRGQITFMSYFEDRTYNDLPVPAAQNTTLDTFTVNVTNPDPCRPAQVFTEREVDIYVVLPAGAGAGTGQASDEMWYMRNSGSSTIVGAYSQSASSCPRR